MSENVSFGEDLTYTPFEALDPRFKPLVNGTAKLERLYTGCRWAEGPVWFRDGDFLVCSATSRTTGSCASDHTGRHRQRLPPAVQQHQRPHPRPAGPAGLLRASAAGGSSAPSTTAPSPCWPTSGTASGSTRPTTPWSSPTARSGSPTRAYGITDRPRGLAGPSSEIGACHVYCLDPATGELRVVADDFVKPNGIAFSPDEKHPLHRRHRRHPRPGRPAPHPRLRRRRHGQADAAARCSPPATAGLFDGFRCDDRRPHLDQRRPTACTATTPTAT